MAPLPFVAELLVTLRERFPKALEKVWEVTDPMLDRPGLHRENVFDFDSGLRLLISKDKLIDLKPEIHVSASWERNQPTTIREAHRQVNEAYHLLGGKEYLRFLGQSANGIPHFIGVDLGPEPRTARGSLD